MSADDEHRDRVRSLNTERARPVPEQRHERADLVQASLLRDLIALLDEAHKTPPMHAPDPEIRRELEARGIPGDSYYVPDGAS